MDAPPAGDGSRGTDTGPAKLRKLVKAHRRRHRAVIAFTGTLAVINLVLGLREWFVHQVFSVDSLMGLISWAGVTYVIWPRPWRCPPLEGPLEPCRVVRPATWYGAPLRIRRPDGALFRVHVWSRGAALLNVGDTLWCAALRDGGMFVGMDPDQSGTRGELAAGAVPLKQVVPPGRVPRSWAGKAPQDALAGSPRRLSIQPLSSPAMQPDGIDAAQAAAALVADLRPRDRPPPDSPLEGVVIDGDRPPSGHRHGGRVVVRRTDGQRFAWNIRCAQWPSRGTAVWATRVAPGIRVWLVAPTPTGDVVAIAPAGPADLA